MSATSISMREITCQLRDIQIVAQLAAGWLDIDKAGPTVEARTMRKVAAMADDLAQRIGADGPALIHETCEADVAFHTQRQGGAA